MHRPRHRPRSSAHLTFSLLAVLALLVCAALPALAQAEDSSGIQYETDHYESGVKPKDPSSGNQGEPKAGVSKTGTGDQQKGTQPTADSGEKTEEDKGGAAPGSGGNDDNGGAGKNATSGGGQPQTGIGDEQPVATASGEQASDSSSSSPLVPILIAIAVLAAISIGAVIYRQRRQDSGGSGSPVSSKAG